MAAGFSLALSHVGYYVSDVEKMVDFYTRFLKFVVSDRGDRDDGGAIVFMTRDPNEHHQRCSPAANPPYLVSMSSIKYHFVSTVSPRCATCSTR